MKLVFNITFHQHLEPLKFYLNNLLNWNLASDSTFVLVSAHQDNLDIIKRFITKKFPRVTAHYVFVPVDLGYHKGTIENIRSGLAYIRSHIGYKYIINVEGDNMFWSEKKFIGIVENMEKQKKHFLLIPEGGPQNNYRRSWKTVEPYKHITTLNIFSKEFITKYFPFDIVDEFYDLGWCGQDGTPFEAYFCLCMNKKFSLNTTDKQESFYSNLGLLLDYDFTRIVHKGWYFPDNLVPDKFIKWGIVNCLSTAGGRLDSSWEPVIEFIRLHEGIV